MPARDLYHDAVVSALLKDGWTITDDPYHIAYGSRDLYIDLGAERFTIAAEKQAQKIAVEIKNFSSPSPISDLEAAIGQYGLYRILIEETQPDRVLFLAAPLRAYEGILTEKFGQFVIDKLQIRLLIFDENQERIVKWIS
ncbi:MAG: XisH family protein [Plectolyngbya sp. WJT66-NPBG17]|jgi:hypothetical protein|nr:XisH family protein [Plectolyngbya sp. WJT66-NPBG17]